MAKDFRIAFKEWVDDNRYEIEEDIGWEYSDDLETGPTPVDRSSTLKWQTVFNIKDRL